jgi:hypothetical protein
MAMDAQKEIGGHCADAENIVLLDALSNWEMSNLYDASAYCRAWGMIDDPNMRCPFGCVPERWLTEKEVRSFMRRILATMKIELEKLETGWRVRWGQLWEDRLCLDEALGCVASIMFTGHAPYLKNELQHFLWNARYGDIQHLLTEEISSRART